jgi:hypothetical protein
VIVRIRPLLHGEEPSDLSVHDKEVFVNEANRQKRFAFSSVYDEHATQVAFFQFHHESSRGRPVPQQCLQHR